MSTKIAWTNATCNPFPGCRKVSPGCLNCYAERMAKRLKAMGQSKYENVVDAKGWTGRVYRAPQIGRIPGKGKMVFVNSMGDLAYEAIPQSDFNVTMEWMRIQPQHTFQVLTKRPESLVVKLRGYFAQYGMCEKPVLSNVWLGVTICNQLEADQKIASLLQIPAAVRFISVEPMLGPLNLHRVKDQRQPYKDFTLTFDSLSRKGGIALKEGLGLDGIIVGCESGPKKQRRPCQKEWLLDLYDQCEEAGVPKFFKQVEIGDKVVHDAARIAAWMGKPVESIRQFPKGARP